MKEIFDNYIENSFGREEQAVFKFSQFAFNYRRYFPADRRAKVLDIGVGRGEMLSCMRDWGYEDYEGVDISPATIRYCESIGLRCKLVSDSAAFLAERPGQYALISMLDVLEHIPRAVVVAYVATLRDALVPGGAVIFQIPNAQAVESNLHRYNDITHEFGYTEHSLAQVLIAAGFSKYQFGGFEEWVFGGPKEQARKLLRSLYWRWARFTRKITGNKDPEILHPVMYVVAWR